jgi:uncharacterized protein
MANIIRIDWIDACPRPKMGAVVMLVLYGALGLGAGVLTTLAGQGGGLVLLLACSGVVGPHAALALTSPALLLGNLHRATLLRTSIDKRVAGAVIAGALPGALAGGLLAGVTPTWALRGLLVLMTVIAIAKAVGLLRFDVPRTALVPGGFVVGAMTGTSGGAGILFAPMLLSVGLRGRAFVATVSAVAVSAHVGRVIGYAGLGLFAKSLLAPTLIVTLAIFVGNALGDRLRTHLTERRSTLLEFGTLAVCVTLSVAGIV